MIPRSHHPKRTRTFLAAALLMLGCSRSTAGPEPNRDDVMDVATVHLECPRENLRPVLRPEAGQHVRWFEGCGREGQYRWSRGEVPLSGPKGWSAQGAPRPAGADAFP